MSIQTTNPKKMTAIPVDGTLRLKMVNLTNPVTVSSVTAAEDWYIGHANTHMVNEDEAILIQDIGHDENAIYALSEIIARESELIARSSMRGSGNVLMMSTYMADLFKPYLFECGMQIYGRWQKVGIIHQKITVWANDNFTNDKLVIAYYGSEYDACVAHKNNTTYGVYMPASNTDYLIRTITLR